MKVAGIIAEYNPFHNGHHYQLEQVRAQTGADFVVIAMSGDFVQRGEPAIYDKYTRTAMALNCGADLVLELPVCFATGSAQDFAACGVALLDQLGIVDVLCFGSELGALAPLETIAGVLCQEPEAYRLALKELLKQGLSYPSARSEALSRYLIGAPDDVSSILSSPNNILAIEYLKALLRQKSTMTPYTIRRIGRDYHDEQISNQHGDPASATALRRLLTEDAFASLHPWIPNAALQALAQEQAQNAPVFPDDLSGILQYRLLELLNRKEDLSQYADLSEELASRLERLALEPASFSGRIAQLKTRQYTYTRISRALLHLILGITSAQMQEFQRTGCAPYARVLGFRRSSTALLAALKQDASIPLITKTADANQILSETALPLFMQDLYASHLYQSLVFQKGRSMKNEYTKSVIVIP